MYAIGCAPETMAHSSGGESACLISTRSVVRVHLGQPGAGLEPKKRGFEDSDCIVKHLSYLKKLK